MLNSLIQQIPEKKLSRTELFHNERLHKTLETQILSENNMLNISFSSALSALSGIFKKEYIKNKLNNNVLKEEVLHLDIF